MHGKAAEIGSSSQPCTRLPPSDSSPGDDRYRTLFQRLCDQEEHLMGVQPRRPHQQLQYARPRLDLAADPEVSPGVSQPWWCSEALVRERVVRGNYELLGHGPLLRGKREQRRVLDRLDARADYLVTGPWERTDRQQTERDGVPKQIGERHAGRLEADGERVKPESTGSAVGEGDRDVDAPVSSEPVFEDGGVLRGVAERVVAAEGSA